MEVINILNKMQLFDDLWHPRIIGELNGQYVKLAKLKGTFIWHSHKDEDELFYILKGCLILEFRDGKRAIREGEMLIVPKGVEHRPIAEEDTWVMLFEPKATKHTGGITSELTVESQDWI